MTINITAETILKLKQVEFNHDEMFSLYFVLKALDLNEIELLDNFDDLNTAKRAAICYQTLFRKSLIEKNKEGSPIFFKLTTKGKELLESLEPVKVIKKIDCSDWIEEWTNLFPDERGIRSDIVDTLPRMNAFIKKFNYTKEVILAATKAYLTKESSDSHRYTKRAMFFIDKRTEGSLLAAWCKTVLENKTKDGSLNDGSRTQIIQTVN